MRLIRSVLTALLGACLSLGALAQAGQSVLLGVDTRLNRIVTLDPMTGAVLNGSFITDANNLAGSYDFQTPRAAIQVGNQIWVSDQSPNVNAIYRFDLSGQYLSKIGGNVAGGGLSNVRGMRVIGNQVYVVNAGNTNGAPGPALLRYGFDGSLLGSFSTAVNANLGNSPWDVIAFDGKLLVSDGTSRALQLYNLDGSHAGAFSAALNNIPQQMFVRANGNVLMSANGSQPLNSFGLYELSGSGQVLKSWTGAPGLGVRGVHELGNGRYLISEAGGSSAARGLGTIDPNGVLDNSNFTLIQGNYNGGWISAAVIPEPPALLLMLGGLGLLLLRRRTA
jgi:hypothetical protein